MNYGTASKKASREGAGAAALIVKQAIESDVRKAVGSDSRMSNAGSKNVRAAGGAPLKVRYDVVGQWTAVAAVYALAKAGPWKLLEGGSPRHEIRPSVNNQIYGDVKATIPGGGRNKFRAQRQANLKARKASTKFGLTSATERGVRTGLGGTAGFLGNKAKGFGAAYVTNHPGSRGRRLFIPGVQRVAPLAMRKAQRTFIQALYNGVK